jgi:hypothetical protein
VAIILDSIAAACMIAKRWWSVFYESIWTPSNSLTVDDLDSRLFLHFDAVSSVVGFSGET